MIEKLQQQLAIDKKELEDLAGQLNANRLKAIPSY
jgi:hypothetical protein